MNSTIINYEVKESSEQILERFNNTKSDSLYLINFDFKFHGRVAGFSIKYDYPMEAPRREEVVMLRFPYDDTIRRITASVEYIFHEYYPKGTLTNINKDAYIIRIFLHGVTEQPI